MKATRAVQKILANYEGETPGVKANLCRFLMAGKLGGTGKMIVLPVDQRDLSLSLRESRPAGPERGVRASLPGNAASVSIEAPYGRERAEQIIRAAMEDYEEEYGGE